MFLENASSRDGTPLQYSCLEKSHGWRSLVGCSPWGCEESDMTERLHFHFSLSCIGEGNGNPLQCSCLENPRDRGTWWAAVHGVTQSRTQLKWLSSSSSSSPMKTRNQVNLMETGWKAAFVWVSKTAILRWDAHTAKSWRSYMWGISRIVTFF